MKTQVSGIVCFANEVEPSITSMYLYVTTTQDHLQHPNSLWSYSDKAINQNHNKYIVW